MGGGLMQLVAYGAQDIYLTGNPQITFFKVVYRRHTNFSMESIQQTFNGTVGAGNRQTVTISRNGDLVHKMYLEYTNGVTDHDINPGHHGINSVELEIGGQKIDKHFGHWMEAWVELTEPNSAGAVGDEAVPGSGTKFQNMACAGGHIGDSSQPCTVPLQFWFCRNPGLALPLIALQYHEVKVIVEWQSGAGTTPSSEELWVDYIYLDTDERRRFAQVSHEYLIEQVQHQVSSDATTELNFNHPVKELIWTGPTVIGDGTRTGLTNTSYQIKLNGHDRIAARPVRYFCLTQVWQHHTGTPVSGTPGTSAATGKASVDEIAVYSFALKPEEHQPSGTCNFSRIDNAQLIGTGGSTTSGMNIYAVNYNVLRIMSGMGGLAYSN
jgi:hypothetical protein